jgi:hypothetical protein
MWALAIAVPTSFSKGRSFELDQLERENGLEKAGRLQSWPVVFALTVAGGEPESIRGLAIVGVMLTGLCIVSVAFDFAPKRQQHNEAVAVADVVVDSNADAYPRG